MLCMSEQWMASYKLVQRLFLHIKHTKIKQQSHKECIFVISGLRNGLNGGPFAASHDGKTSLNFPWEQLIYGVFINKLIVVNMAENQQARYRFTNALHKRSSVSLLLHNGTHELVTRLTCLLTFNQIFTLCAFARGSFSCTRGQGSQAGGGSFQTLRLSFPHLPCLKYPMFEIEIQYLKLLDTNKPKNISSRYF